MQKQPRMLGYQGKVSPTKPQRQSGTSGSSNHAGLPKAPARCATAVRGEENPYPPRRAQRDLILPPAAPLPSPMRLSYVPISQAKRASVFSPTVDKFVPKSVSMMMEKFVPKEAAETKSMMAMESMPTKAPADVDRASSGLG